MHQESVLGPILYTFFTSDRPTKENVVIGIYADDTATLATRKSTALAADIVQTQLNVISDWLKIWSIKVNAEKSNHVTFSLKKGDCSPVYLDRTVIPMSDHVKYLGLVRDKRLTWTDHIKQKRNQLELKTKRNSKEKE